MTVEQQLLNRLLKQLTKSKNYEIVEDCGYRLYYKGKNIPCGCKSVGREQIVYANHADEFARKLLCMIKFRHQTSITTKEYIDRMNYLFDQCLSHIAYGYNFENSRYIKEINLPYSLKQDVYNYVKSIIVDVDSNVYTDSEGCSYNSIKVASIL